MTELPPSFQTKPFFFKTFGKLTVLLHVFTCDVSQTQASRGPTMIVAPC